MVLKASSFASKKHRAFGSQELGLLQCLLVDCCMDDTTSRQQAVFCLTLHFLKSLELRAGDI